MPIRAKQLDMKGVKTELEKLGGFDNAELELKVKEISESLKNKVEFASDIQSGSLVVADNAGKIKCANIKYDELVKREEIVTSSSTASVIADKSGLTTITIPRSVRSYPSIHVFHNGMLLVKDTHYSVFLNTITLIDYVTYKGDTFTFMGYGSTGSLIIDGEEYLKKDEILDEDGYIYPELIRDDIITGGLVLGDTEDTAFRGDLGKLAYEHAMEAHAPVNAQENVIEVLALGNEESGILTVVDKKVTIPIGTEENLGVVKSSKEMDKVSIDEDGTMSLNTIDATKLVVPEGKELVLVCGNANN